MLPTPMCPAEIGMQTTKIKRKRIAAAYPFGTTIKREIRASTRVHDAMQKKIPKVIGVSTFAKVVAVNIARATRLYTPARLKEFFEKAHMQPAIKIKGYEIDGIQTCMSNGVNQVSLICERKNKS